MFRAAVNLDPVICFILVYTLYYPGTQFFSCSGELLYQFNHHFQFLHGLAGCACVFVPER